MYLEHGRVAVCEWQQADAHHRVLPPHVAVSAATILSLLEAGGVAKGDLDSETGVIRVELRMGVADEAK